MLFSKDNYMVLSTELHLSKSNECHQLFLLCGGIMFISHELEDVEMVFVSPPLLLGIPSLNMVVCSFVRFCVNIPRVHGDF